MTKHISATPFAPHRPLRRCVGSVRADDLGAVPLKALMERNPQVNWTASTTSSTVAPTRPVRTTATWRACLDCWPGCRMEVPGTTVNRLCGSIDGCGGPGGAFHQVGRDGSDDCRRRGKHVTCALCDGQGRSVPSRAALRSLTPPSAGVLRQSADEEAVRHALHAADRRQRGCRLQHFPRRSGRLCPAFPAALGCRARRRAAFRRTGAGGDPGKKGDPILFTTDEHPRPDTTLDMLAKLKGVNGPELTVTAGNASGVNDGACALLLASGKPWPVPTA
jgi:acetyl-CoA acyltransferase